jgi:hypothetical protein
MIAEEATRAVAQSIRIFISYAREDLAKAERLHDELAMYPELEPWLDQKKLVAGDDWEQVILGALDKSDYTVLLLSQHAVSKTGFVQREVREVLERALMRPPGERYIIPARLDDCYPVHRELSRLHYIDLFPDWSTGLCLLLQGLGLKQYTHCYVACGVDKGGKAILIPAGAPIPSESDGIKYVNVYRLPAISVGLVPTKGLERDGMQSGIFIKLWTVASADWPRTLYRKSDWRILDEILFPSSRSDSEKELLVEIVTRQWALARELSPYDEDDWRALRKLIQKPTY